MGKYESRKKPGRQPTSRNKSERQLSKASVKKTVTNKEKSVQVQFCAVADISASQTPPSNHLGSLRSVGLGLKLSDVYRSRNLKNTVNM